MSSSYDHSNDNHIAHDAAIAAALAREDQEQMAAELARQLNAPSSGHHNHAHHYPGDRRRASGTHQYPPTNHPHVYPGRGSQSSNNGGVVRGSVVTQQQPHPTAGVASNNHPSVYQDAAPPPFAAPQNTAGIIPPFLRQQQQQPQRQHMCSVPVIIGSVCVEMDVDSGAQCSVMSLPLAKQLGLEAKIDKRHQGVAKGVGQAVIVGLIQNVICVLGNVEFAMDFIVLDIPDNLLLLGLDLMRKYKCIIDLESERLVFGGLDGVAVPMLPPGDGRRSRDQQSNCTIM